MMEIQDTSSIYPRYLLSAHFQKTFANSWCIAVVHLTLGVMPPTPHHPPHWEIVLHAC